MKFSNRNEISTKFLIIGAGISGLSFASNLNSNEYIILEKENCIGGYCKTFINNGYIWDYGGHFFHFNNKEIKNKFKKILSSSETIKVKKNSKIYINNSYIDYPFQNNIYQLDKDNFLRCLYDFYYSKKLKVRNFKDYVKSYLGDSIANMFIIPYNEKLYSCDLNSLDKSAMGRFFPKTSLDDIVCNIKKTKDDSYNNYFYYSKYGAFSFVKEIAKGVELNNVFLNSNILKIDTKLHIAYTKTHKIQYEYLINTIPFNNFYNLLYGRNNVVFSSNKVYVFNLGFDKPSVNTKIHWCYYPEKNICFYRVGFYNNILRMNKMSLYVEIGAKNINKFNERSKLREVINDLKKVGVITNHKLVDYNVVEMEPAYVHISIKSLKLMEKMENKLSKMNIYTIGRYGKWTYCSIEDCILMADSLYKKLHINYDKKNI